MNETGCSSELYNFITLNLHVVKMLMYRASIYGMQ